MKENINIKGITHSDIAGMYLNNFKNEQVKIKCPTCGEEAVVDTGMILTSYPPKYNCDCPNCGHFYIDCSKVDELKLNDYVLDNLETIIYDIRNSEDNIND